MCFGNSYLDSCAPQSVIAGAKILCVSTYQAIKVL